MDPFDIALNEHRQIVIDMDGDGVPDAVYDPLHDQVDALRRPPETAQFSPWSQNTGLPNRASGDFVPPEARPAPPRPNDPVNASVGESLAPILPPSVGYHSGQALGQAGNDFTDGNYVGGTGNALLGAAGIAPVVPAGMGAAASVPLAGVPGMIIGGLKTSRNAETADRVIYHAAQLRERAGEAVRNADIGIASGRPALGARSELAELSGALGNLADDAAKVPRNTFVEPLGTNTKIGAGMGAAGGFGVASSDEGGFDATDPYDWAKVAGGALAGGLGERVGAHMGRKGQTVHKGNSQGYPPVAIPHYMEEARGSVAHMNDAVRSRLQAIDAIPGGMTAPGSLDFAAVRPPVPRVNAPKPAGSPTTAIRQSSQLAPAPQRGGRSVSDTARIEASNSGARSSRQSKQRTQEATRTRPTGQSGATGQNNASRTPGLPSPSYQPPLQLADSPVGLSQATKKNIRSQFIALSRQRRNTSATPADIQLGRNIKATPAQVQQYLDFLKTLARETGHKRVGHQMNQLLRWGRGAKFAIPAAVGTNALLNLVPPPQN